MQADDLDAVYDQILEELKIAKKLREKLGRAVESLAPAECVCGLREGVLEHDRERMEAAIEAATKLHLADKLAKPLEAARVEIEKLKVLMPLPLRSSFRPRPFAAPHA